MAIIDPIKQEMIDAGAEDIARMISMEANKIGIDDLMAFGIVSAEIMAKNLECALLHFKHNEHAYTPKESFLFFQANSSQKLFHSNTKEGICNELISAIKYDNDEIDTANMLLKRLSETLKNSRVTLA